MRKIVVHLQSTLDNRIANAQGAFWEPFPWGEPEVEITPAFAEFAQLQRRMTKVVFSNTWSSNTGQFLIDGRSSAKAGHTLIEEPWSPC